MKSDMKEPVRSGLLSETLPLFSPSFPLLPHSLLKNELLCTVSKFIIQHFSHFFFLSVLAYS